MELHSMSFSLEHMLSKPRMAVTFAFLMYEPDCNAVVSRGTQSIAIITSYRLIHKQQCEANIYSGVVGFVKCDLLKFS